MGHCEMLDDWGRSATRSGPAEETANTQHHWEESWGFELKKPGKTASQPPSLSEKNK